MQYANNTTMDHDLAIYGNAVYFNDGCIVKGWQKVTAPIRVEQLDPDCPEDLRADEGVKYNNPPRPNYSFDSIVIRDNKIVGKPNVLKRLLRRAGLKKDYKYERPF